MSNAAEVADEFCFEQSMFAQVTEAQNSVGSDGAPASAAQQQQQADALAAAAQQPAAAAVAAAAKPLEPPEPDEYSVSLLHCCNNPMRKHRSAILLCSGLLHA